MSYIESISNINEAEYVAAYRGNYRAYMAAVGAAFSTAPREVVNLIVSTLLAPTAHTLPLREVWSADGFRHRTGDCQRIHNLSVSWDRGRPQLIFYAKGKEEGRDRVAIRDGESGQWLADYTMPHLSEPVVDIVRNGDLFTFVLDDKTSSWYQAGVDELRHQYNDDGPMLNLRFEPDSGHYIAVMDLQTVKIWDWRGKKPPQRINVNPQMHVQLHDSDQGALVLTGQRAHYWEGPFATVMDPNQWHPAIRDALQPAGPSEIVMNMTFDPDYSYLFVGIALTQRDHATLVCKMYRREGLQYVTTLPSNQRVDGVQKGDHMHLSATTNIVGMIFDPINKPLAKDLHYNNQYHCMIWDIHSKVRITTIDFTLNSLGFLNRLFLTDENMTVMREHNSFRHHRLICFQFGAPAGNPHYPLKLDLTTPGHK